MTRTRGLPAWRAMRYFCLYRLVLTGLFAVLVVTGNLPQPFGDTNPELFSAVAFGYLILAVALLAAVETRVLPYRLQVFIQVLTDIVAITLLMDASGGVRSQLGILMVVSIAWTSLLSSGRMALLSAALASLAVLAETVYSIYVSGVGVNPSQAGLLGVVMFATALIGYLLAERVRITEAIAARQAVDILNLSQLNEHIVQRMRSGVIVLDPLGQIVLMNAAARNMLGMEFSNQASTLSDVSPGLQTFHENWLRSSENPIQPFVTQAKNIEIIPSFIKLGGTAEFGTLIYLEDAAEMRQRAQQLKLASLGRLTASIAHEIRNPLGAISHAGQLLSESTSLEPGDHRLTEIIGQHSRRMNAIIENVLSIGRREVAFVESFDLKGWLQEFAAEFVERKGLETADVVVAADRDWINVRMDKNQLHQVVWNLAENALRYSRTPPYLSLECGIFPESERPFLEVKDTGPGMTNEIADHVFEPFFTNEPSGTGLGLYIARELCESNQASLTLLEHGEQGCRFRLTFVHPERRQLTA